MIIEKISYKDGDINDFVADEILMEAKRAVQENSYGVGGALLDIKNGKVIKTMHNQVMPMKLQMRNHVYKILLPMESVSL